MTANIHLIENNNRYLEILEQIKNAEIYFLDTEFIRETTYRPIVALIQIAIDDQNAYLIDPTFEGFDYKPLVDLISHPNKKIIMHSARQDLEIFYFHFNFLPNNLIDTQIVAAALGYGDQIGFEGLVKTVLNHGLDKSQQRTDWLKRPLTEKQMKYAADDVIYLAKIYPFLIGALESQGRSEWIKDEIVTLTNPQIFEVSLKTLMKKIRHKLNGAKAINTLKALVMLREEIAEKKDRIRTMICPDTTLITLAEKRPKTEEDLLSIKKNVKYSFIEKYKTPILETITNALTIEPAPSVPSQKLSIPQERLSLMLSTAAEATSMNQAVARRLFATSQDIIDFIRTDQARFLTGWRYELFGKIVQEITAGQKGLYYDSGQIVVR